MMIQAQLRLAPLCQRYLADALAQLAQDTELESLLNGLVGDRPLPWALVAQGNHLRSKGRLDEAQALYEKGIELFPMLPALFDGLSAIHDARGDSLAAQQYLEKGIRISTHALQRQVELGKLARRNEDYAQPKNDPALIARSNLLQGSALAKKWPEGRSGALCALRDTAARRYARRPAGDRHL